MLSFLLSRLLQAAPALLGVTLVAFALLQLSGDVTYVLLPPEASDEERAALRHRYGLDDPIVVQYVRYVGRLLQGDFGRSFVQARPAIDVVLNRFPATLELTAAATLIGVSLAIPIGVISAMRQNSILDRLVTVMILLGQSIPGFWLGMLLILAFAVHLPWFPVSGRGDFDHLVLPSLTLATWPFTLTARLTRSGMLDVLSHDYIRTARAKGMGEAAVAWRHALRNAMLPIVTVIGLNLGGMLGGAVIIETVFAWPGLGMLMSSSVLSRDYPVVLAALLFGAGAFMIINLIVDLLYGSLDPRIRSTHGR